jgi:hypothetical protein
VRGLIFAPVTTNKPDTPEYDAGNQRHVERRRKAGKQRERQLAEAFKWLMGDARGRMLMWDRLAVAGVFHSSMAASPELTAFREGRRDIGLRDLGLIMRLCPEQYTRMAAEAQGRLRPSTFESPNGDKDDGRDDPEA